MRGPPRRRPVSRPLGAGVGARGCSTPPRPVHRRQLLITHPFPRLPLSAFPIYLFLFCYLFFFSRSPLLALLVSFPTHLFLSFCFVFFPFPLIPPPTTPELRLAHYPMLGTNGPLFPGQDRWISACFVQVQTSRHVTLEKIYQRPSRKNTDTFNTSAAFRGHPPTEWARLVLGPS